MRFSQDSISNINVIRGYRPGELSINTDLYHGAVLVSPSTVAAESTVEVDQLGEEHAGRILALDPEVVLLGTGSRQIFPSASFSARFWQIGVGFEVMDTAAACRTFNVLAGELRRVVGLLFI